MSQTVASPSVHARRRPVWAVLALSLVACTGGTEPRATPPSTVPSSEPATTVPVTEPATTTTTPSPTTEATHAPTTTSGVPASVVTRGDPDRRIVALTFDAGSDTGFTAQILDVLARSSVPATFGITGKWAEANPDLVRRIAGAGHVLMNHTYDHRSFTGVSARPALLSAAERRADVERTEEIIRGLTGRTTRPWFRPPYGDYDASVNAVVGALGYR